MATKSNINERLVLIDTWVTAGLCPFCLYELKPISAATLRTCPVCNEVFKEIGGTWIRHIARGSINHLLYLLQDKANENPH